MDKTNQVTFDINVPINSEDLDVIELFLSNKNQAGPNSDFIHFSHTADRKQLNVIYENQSAKQVVIAKKFFTYKHYFIRASETGYRNEILSIDPKVIVLSNIDTKAKSELFAEYLLPDNPIASVQMSKFFAKTAYIIYRGFIDHSLLEKRYIKKHAQLKTSIQYLKAFQTSTILISSKSSVSTCELMDKLSADIHARLGAKPNIFLDKFCGFLICQFNSDLDSSKFLELTSEYLNENSLISEYLYNFDLINEKETEKAEQTVLPKELFHKVESTEHQSIYECFNDMLKCGIPVVDLGANKAAMIQINKETYPILYNCLLKCAKVLSDFKKELEPKQSVKLSISPDHSEFYISSKLKDRDMVSEIVTSFEKQRLEFKKIELSTNMEYACTLIESFQENKHLNSFKSKLSVYFKSEKCMYAYFNEITGCFEAYGYGQAVQCFSQALNSLKTNKIKLTKKKLSLDCDLSNYPLLEMFSKFKGYYFNDFEKKLKLLGGKVSLKDSQGSIRLESIDEQEPIWREEVKKYVTDYLNQFVSDFELNMPFSRDSKQAKEFLYDVNSIEAAWKAECNCLVLAGAKKSIELLMKKINT